MAHNYSLAIAFLIGSNLLIFLDICSKFALLIKIIAQYCSIRQVKLAKFGLFLE